MNDSIFDKAPATWSHSANVGISNPKNHGDNILLGHGAFRITAPRTFACAFAGIGVRSVILSEEEHAVVKSVVLRMFAEDLKDQCVE